MTSEIPPFAIDGRPIGPEASPYLIAEISANHGGDFDRALRIIRLCAETGVDAVKFQLYSADSLTLDSDRPEFVISDPGLWQGRRLYDLYREAATPVEWFPELFRYARDAGLTPFASVFDSGDIAFLEDLDIPAYKIASFEAVDLALIQACARTGKPTIISTGLCSLQDIQEAVSAFRDAGGRSLALLRCNSAYPAHPKEANLASIPRMADLFGLPIGYSDHTLDSYQAVAAVALGACLVEKHVIDAREPETADSAFSCLPDQLAELVEGCRAAYDARGSVKFGPTPTDERSLKFRRSLYAATDIVQGESFTPTNVRCVRPGGGLAPKHLPRVLRCTATRAVDRGEPITEDMLQR